MKRVLIISYSFPPMLEGVRRVLKWIEYLPETGWEPAVLTVKPVRASLLDSSPCAKLAGRRISVYRSGSLDPYRLIRIIKGEPAAAAGGGNDPGRGVMCFLRRWLFIPDDRCGWIPFAVLKGLRAIKEFKPDVILSTSWPQSSHLAALVLKRLTGLPWVADFRDGWTQNPVFFKPATGLHEWIQKRLESTVAHQCDVLTTVSEYITEHFRAIAGKDKAHTLSNGYDEADFTGIEPCRPERFRMLYTGTLYGGAKADCFLKAVSAVLREHPEWESDFEIVFRMPCSKALEMMIREEGLEKVAHTREPLPYRETLMRQTEAAVLLLFIAPGPNSRVTVTQKVFEYLRSGRPILAMIPDGACRNILAGLKEPWICEPDNTNAIAGLIKGMYCKWKAGRLDAPPLENLKDYDRRHIARRLGEILDNAAGRRAHF